MTFTSSPERDRILSATGHVIVTGGPGCGKTTVALRKACLRIEAGLLPGQRILFLSFSRAAVARIVEASRDVLPPDIRKHLDIQTFHSFCWHLLCGHGYLLGATTPLRLLAPHDERAMRDGVKEDSPAWNAERERLFLEEGLTAFDLFAPKALSILRRSKAHRRLIADRYPLIIVDEAQDTGNDQWACMEALSGMTQLLCLADLDQQIYDFRPDVSPGRLKQIMTALKPLEVDLGSENNRSPKSEIVKFGNDILAQTPRGAPYIGVSHSQLSPKAESRDKAIRQAVGMLYKQVQDATGDFPRSVGYLTNWGRGVAVIARALQGDEAAGIKEISHRVVMDEAEVFLATRVVALLLEPVANEWETLAVALDLISELYRSRGNSKKVATLKNGADAARQNRFKGGAKCPGALKAILDELQRVPLTGNPGQDWLRLRKALSMSGVEELTLVGRLVFYLLALNRGRRISDALAQVWLQNGNYRRAREIVETAIAEEQIIGGDGDLRGINVMTMHKSKGKEFDAVILLHLGNNISPFCSDYEPAPYLKSRRLLRVGITRAKHHVLLLTDVMTPSPLLTGHKL